MKQNFGINPINRQRSLDEGIIMLDGDPESKISKKITVFDKFIPNGDGSSINDGSQPKLKHVKLNVESVCSDDSNGKITFLRELIFE